MQGKGTLLRPHESKFRSYISQGKDDAKFFADMYLCLEVQTKHESVSSVVLLTNNAVNGRMRAHYFLEKTTYQII